MRDRTTFGTRAVEHDALDLCAAKVNSDTHHYVFRRTFEGLSSDGHEKLWSSETLTGSIS